MGTPQTAKADLESARNISFALIGNSSKVWMIKRQLESRNLSNITVFNSGKDLLEILSYDSFTHIYVVSAPRDMDEFTFLRILRSKKLKNSPKIACIYEKTYSLPKGDKSFLAMNDINIIHVNSSVMNSACHNVAPSQIHAILDEKEFSLKLEKTKSFFREALEDQARNIFKQLLKNSNTTTYSKQGVFKTDCPRASWKHLKKVIDSDPSEYNYKFAAVDKLVTMGRTSMAEKFLNKILASLQSQDETYWLNELGVIAAANKVALFVKRIYEILSEVSLSHLLWQPDLIYARLFLMNGDLNKAGAHLKKSESLAQTGQPEIENMRAVLAMKAKNYKEALASYKEALKLAPDDYRISFNIGLCLETMGEPGEAVTYYRSAIDHFPLYKKALLRLRNLEESAN